MRGVQLGTVPPEAGLGNPGFPQPFHGRQSTEMRNVV